mmetsp:Transcript_4057/g.7209  ORF Transcript_4057/g.7209 Transcript_4057/m.7209 type:complete len:145 (+) Transcript_4057:411-845(+)
MNDYHSNSSSSSSSTKPTKTANGVVPRPISTVSLPTTTEDMTSSYHQLDGIPMEDFANESNDDLAVEKSIVSNSVEQDGGEDFENAMAYLMSQENLAFFLGKPRVLQQTLKNGYQPRIPSCLRLPCTWKSTISRLNVRTVGSLL